MQTKKIIVIGAGFAGLVAAKKLARCGQELEITLIDAKVTADFLPLAPDCIGRGIHPEHLTISVVEFCRKHKINFIKAHVTGVDFGNRRVFCDSCDLSYDYLLIASGSQTNFFSDLGAQSYAYALNSVEQVKKIIAGLKSNKFNNFIICGGGYTGIETATNLWRYFKRHNQHKKIMIVERAPSILGPLPDWMKIFVQNNLAQMNIEILANAVVEHVQKDRVKISGRAEFEQAMLVWVPGVRTADFIQKLVVAKSPQGRILVDEYLKVNESCFCAGDAAFFGSEHNFLRMAIQFAISQGARAAGNIIQSIQGGELKKFRPLDLGYVIPLANDRSCGIVFGFKLKGMLPTVLHFMMCIYRSWGWKSRWGLICDLLKKSV